MTVTIPGSPKRMLVPVDLSRRSQVGLSYAAVLARRLDCDLVLGLNVNLPERAYLEERPEAGNQSVEDLAHAALEQLGAEFCPDLTWTTMVGFADYPAEGVLAMANKSEADLIVVASHGRSGISRWVLGSVAERVARSADVPVVVVPSHDDRKSRSDDESPGESS